jgi:hypothetical protein
MAMARNFVLLKTDLFLCHQPDEGIDQWQVGADCAGWFYARLLPVQGIKPSQAPMMEDWGWTFTVEVDEIQMNVNVWAFLVVENAWLFGIEAQRRLFGNPGRDDVRQRQELLANAMDAIMEADPRFQKRMWYEANPFELNVRAF